MKSSFSCIIISGNRSRHVEIDSAHHLCRYLLKTEINFSRSRYIKFLSTCIYILLVYLVEFRQRCFASRLCVRAFRVRLIVLAKSKSENRVLQANCVPPKAINHLAGKPLLSSTSQLFPRPDWATFFGPVLCAVRGVRVHSSDKQRPGAERGEKHVDAAVVDDLGSTATVAEREGRRGNRFRDSGTVKRSTHSRRIGSSSGGGERRKKVPPNQWRRGKRTCVPDTFGAAPIRVWHLARNCGRVIRGFEASTLAWCRRTRTEAR